MTASFFHPATIQLLQLQSRGRRRRMWNRFRQTRRLFLSAIACVLAVVWLGNAVMTIWLREAASPETLRALLSLGLVFYAGWHIAKAAFFRPDSPFDWTTGECELLAAMPLRPRDLVAYQLASTTMTTLVKAGLFTLLLLPDLRSVGMGFVGVMLVMLLLEMLRMAVQIVTWSMSRSTFFAYRLAVVVLLVSAGFAAGTLMMLDHFFAGRMNVGEGILGHVLDILVRLNDTVFAYVALPFQPFIDVILAASVTARSMGLVAANIGIVAVLAAGVVRLYSSSCQSAVDRERRSYCCDAAPRGSLGRHSELTIGEPPGRICELSTRRIPRWGGAGIVAWRQLVGARRQWGSLLTAMIAPAILSLAPCYVIEDPYIALLATAGTMAFYTFLLLPTALRFDFRRDLDRLAMLKALPMTSAAAVAGQVLAPVAIATLFQCALLGLAIAARSLPPHYLVLTMLVMIPLNVLVFALENLIFMLYPYRVQQEGLEIFFRTMLTFTGKGLLFAVGLGLMSVWGFAAADLTRGFSRSTGVSLNAFAVFTTGMVAGPSIFAALVFYALCVVFRNLDPSDDLSR